MKIIQRAKKELHYKFLVVKSVVWDGKITQPGDEIEIQNQAEADGMVQNGRVRPADLPPTGIYIALAEITLPGNVEKFSCKKMDLIELKGEDGLRLMLSGQVIPQNDDQWRFHNRRLGQPKIDYRKRHEFEALEKLRGIQAAAEHLAKLKTKPETYTVEAGAMDALVKMGKATKK